MIASHSRIVSFPETHFFSATLPINPVFRKLKFHGHASRETISRFLSTNGYGDIHPFANIPFYKLHSYRNWCRMLTDILDRMIAHDADLKSIEGPVWGLEKTPRHLHYISSIEQSRTPNNFIHILRRGEEVVASLHLATTQYPEEWGGERSVKKCINWWNSSMKTSLKHREQANHFFAVYSQLIETPEPVLKAICNFLGLDFQRAMLHDFHRTAGSLTQEEEKWKDKNRSRSLDKSNKLQQHFDASTIDYISRRLMDIDLKQFYH